MWFDEHWFGLALFLHDIWWIEMSYSVSFTLGSLNWGGKSFFSHLVWNALGIILRYSEEVVRIIRKMENNCAGKTELQLAGWFEKRLQHSVSLRILPEGCSENYFFHIFLAVLYTHSRNFLRKVHFSNNWALFPVHVWFSYHGAKAFWWVKEQNEAAIILTKYSC